MAKLPPVGQGGMPISEHVSFIDLMRKDCEQGNDEGAAEFALAEMQGIARLPEHAVSGAKKDYWAALSAFAQERAQQL